MNPILDGFRDRAAHAVLPDGRAGVIYVESSSVATQMAGHLWWKRWSAPTETAIVHYDLPDGEVGDTWIADEDLLGEVDDWRAGRYEGMSVEGRRPRLYNLTWMDEDASEVVRRSFIGDENAGDGRGPRA